MRKIVGTVFLDWNEPFEGYCLHPYLDTKGLVTVGVGNLIDASPKVPAWSPALPLPWKVGERMASDEEIVGQWRKLKSFAVPEKTIEEWRKNHGGAPLPLQLRGGGRPEMQAVTTIRLTKDDVSVLVRRVLLDMASTVRAQFPAFDEWPADAQLALLSVSWARGAHGYASEFPKMTAALRARDFETAAQECGLAGGYEDRDAADRTCFLAAARCDREHLDPEVLHSKTPATLNLPPPTINLPTSADVGRAIRKALEDDRDGES